MRRQVWIMGSLLLVASVVSAVACDDKKSGAEFGDAKVAQPGVHVKPAATPAEDVLPDFKAAVKTTPVYDPATQQLKVTIDVAEGFHAYAPGEKTGVPVALTVAAVNGWTMDGKVNTPAGKEKEVAGEKSLILEGAIPVSATVKGGKGDIKGSVRVQVCTNKSCDRPRTHDFQIPAGA